MSRYSSDNVLGGIGSPSGVRKPSSRSAAFFSLGLKPRMPSRTNVALIRLMIRPPDNKQRFDQNRQVGQVLDQLLDAGFKLHLPDHPHLEAEVTQSAAQVVVDGDR